MPTTPDIANFDVRFYLKNNDQSPVEEYLNELMTSNLEMAIKATSALISLPTKIVLGDDIKPMKNNGKTAFWELRVQSGSNICRFFYVLDRPNVIVFFGFTKQTQKTDKKDIEQGLRNLESYRDYQNSVSMKDIFG